MKRKVFLKGGEKKEIQRLKLDKLAFYQSANEVCGRMIFHLLWGG